MRVQRGDVILVNYPFASGSGSKVRPAVVVQCDRNNDRLDNTIIAQITSRTRHAKAERTQLLVEASSPTGQQAGLLIDSAVSCENLYRTSTPFGRMQSRESLAISPKRSSADC